MPAPTAKVNLLPPSEFEQSFWGRFLKWAVTTGRHIIIIVELVVILAFFSRFKLDEDLRNWNEQINGQISYLESQLPRQTEFLKLQKRLNLASQMLSLRLMAGDTFDYLAERLPAEVSPIVRTVDENGLSLTALTLNEQAMGELLSTLSADLKWKSVDMTELLGDRTSGIRFSVSANK
jgi:hypothetical protein